MSKIRRGGRDVGQWLTLKLVREMLAYRCKRFYSWSLSFCVFNLNEDEKIMKFGRIA